LRFRYRRRLALAATHALTAVADAAVHHGRFILLAARRALVATPNGPAGSGFFASPWANSALQAQLFDDIDLILSSRTRLMTSIRPRPSSARAIWCVCCGSARPTAMCFASICACGQPGSIQLAVATDFAAAYYEREGQTWERAAFIKARPCAGDIAAGEAFLNELSPFVWRRYLDHTAIADVHAMKRQIHAFRGHEQIAVEGHNIKLGRGGIREIEFFVQTQQLIAVGRHPELRGRETLPTLEALAKGGWIGADARKDLEAA
jgi:glutamate-ammonia-ligase adenylyltransferase